MKKITILGFFAAAVLPLSAQHYKANIFGVRGGLNASMLTMNLGNGLDAYRLAKLGWHAGVADQILLSRSRPLYLETGLYLSNKGGGYRYPGRRIGNAPSVEMMYGATYLQVPLKVNWHFRTGAISLEPYAGFHYSFGLWGRLVRETTAPDTARSKEIFDLYGDGIFRRNDFGITLGLGGTWYGLYFGLGWETGFLNLSRAPGGQAYNSSVFLVLAGYNF